MKWFVLLLVALSGLSISCSDSKKEEREYVLGYQGRAKKNPFLAAERYLEAGGHSVNSTNGVLRFDEGESVLISPASSVRSIGDVERILEWVENGGHYVCLLERAEDFWVDVGELVHHNPEDWSEYTSAGSEEAVQLLASRVELEIYDSEQDFVSYQGDYDTVKRGEVLPFSEEREIELEGDENLIVQLGGNKSIRPIREDLYYVGDWYDLKDHSQVFSRGHYSGRVTFISDGRVFRNPYLGFAQNAKLLDYIATGEGKIVFSLGKVRGFYSMLAEYAWMVLFALLLLTVLWLWKNMPRFGPLLDVVDDDARSYREQLKHNGQFYWKYKREDALLDPLREAVLRSLGGGYAMSQDVEKATEEIVARTAMDRNVVHEAMTRLEVKDSASMVRISGNLQKILNTL